MHNTKDKKSKLILNAIGHSYNDIYFFIIPLLLPLFREQFQINYVQSGLILSIHIAIRSVFSLLFGHFGDQYDKRKIIAAGFILSSILLGGLVWANRIETIIALLLLLAIGVSTFHPLATTIVRENSSNSKRGKYLSLFSAAGTAGLVVASLLFGFFVQTWGWKITCLALSLPGYLLAYLYLKSNRDVKKMSSEVGKNNNIQRLPLFYMSLGFRSMGFWAVISFLPIYATDYLSMRVEFSAWIISIFFAGVLFGSLISSRLTDRNQPLVLVLITTFASINLVLGITYIMTPILLLMFIAILGILEGIFFPAQNTWLTFVCPLNKQSKMFGVSLFSEGLAATIAPILFGGIADKIGLIFAYRFALIPISISFTLFMILFILDERFNNSLAIKRI